MRFIPSSRTARVGMVVAVAATLALSSAAAATAATKNKNTYTPAQVHVCYSPTAGTMKLVQPATKCKRGEKRLIWDRVAKAGAKGARGLPGIAGTNGINGIDGIDGTNGTNGTNGADGAKGSAGGQGIAGSDGLNGVDGASAYYLATHLDTDPFVGTVDEWIASLKGDPGLDGTNGTDGTNGLDGTNGTDGLDGTNGTNGLDGTNGTDGAKGDPGTNGTDGVKGDAGTDGTNGTNGTDGTNGTNGGSVLSSVVGSVSAGNTAYAGPGLFSTSGSSTSSAISAPVPFAGTLKNLQVVAGTSSRTITITVYKNDVATTITCNAGNAVTTCNDTTHTVTFAAGDTLSYRIDVSNGAGSRANIRVSTLLQ